MDGVIITFDSAQKAVADSNTKLCCIDRLLASVSIVCIVQGVLNIPSYKNSRTVLNLRTLSSTRFARSRQMLAQHFCCDSCLPLTYHLTKSAVRMLPRNGSVKDLRDALQEGLSLPHKAQVLVNRQAAIEYISSRGV